MAKPRIQLRIFIMGKTFIITTDGAERIHTHQCMMPMIDPMPLACNGAMGRTAIAQF